MFQYETEKLKTKSTAFFTTTNECKTHDQRCKINSHAPKVTLDVCKEVSGKKNRTLEKTYP